MNYKLSQLLNDDTPTKQKIMICALEQFSTKGYTETSIRDIATSVGITPGTIYNHFASKEVIIQNMIDDYIERTQQMFHNFDIKSVLSKNPTGEGMMICVIKSVSILAEDVYYSNLVHLIHQEQHRNTIFANMVLLRLQDTKDFVVRMFDVLKDLKVIKADADAEYCGVIAYMILHMVSVLAAVNIKLSVPGYSMRDLPPILKYMFDMALGKYKLLDESV